jgi:hypothetical protein
MADPASGRPRSWAVERSRIATWARTGFWLLLIVAWVAMVGQMWEALTTLPSAARLEESRMAVIPTPRTFAAAVIFSALELGVVLAALWPWWTAYYPARLGLTAMALVTWFLITVPVGLSQMDWVHRRWLGFMIFATITALVVDLGYRLLSRLLARSRA